jgi:hypothetical protein
MNYQFAVKETKKHDSEIAVIQANGLEEAKKLFSETYPEDIENVEVITSDKGLEEIL